MNQFDQSNSIQPLNYKIMIDTILSHAKGFLGDDNRFWFYHGYGLTFIWTVFATLAIAVRSIKGRASKWTHGIIFSAIDYITLFLGGGVLYKYWGQIYHEFFSWSFLKQVHAVAGVLFISFVMFQHVTGIILLHWGKLKHKHIQPGFIMHFLVGLVAVGGWMINLKLKMAATTIFLYLMSQIVVKFLKAKKKQRHQKST